jgi:ABC-type multidrug transport system ATPase subunit
MKNIQDVLAQNLSGGQKRKLTFGIAILGDPQVSQTKFADEFKFQIMKLSVTV